MGRAAHYPMSTAVHSATLLRRAAPLLSSWGQHCNRGWASSTTAAAPWVLVQRESGASMTATGGGGDAGVHLQRRYDTGSIGGGAEQAAAPRFSISRLRQEVLTQLQATFLPSGYPQTVAPGYLRNTLWQGAHHCAGSANGVLASTFLLYSVGLGAGAVPTAGALNWVLKDGMGQLGTLLFGKTIAHRFDVSSRAWYLLASAKLNLALGLEICTFLLPHFFLPIGALANAIKGLSWMAGGSTKSVFKVAFAADNNFGDISAKATSQTIFSSVVGTSAGVLLASQIEQSVGLALVCYASLSALHMWTGYQAVRCVPLATLNPSRLELLVQMYLEKLQQGLGQEPGDTQQQTQQTQQGLGRQQQPDQQQAQQQQQQQAQRAGHAGWAPGHAASAEPWPEEGQATGSSRVGKPAQQQQIHQQHQQQQQQQAGEAAATAVVQLPTPAALAGVDPVFHKPWVCVGTPLQQLVQHLGGQLGDLLQQQVGQQPIQQQHTSGQQQQHGGQQAAQQAGQGQQTSTGAQLGEQPHQQQQRQQQQRRLHQLHMLVPAGSSMHLLLHEQAAASDCILGFLHAFVLQHGTSGSMTPGLGCGSFNRPPTRPGTTAVTSTADQLRAGLAEARRLLPGLLASLEAAGWDDEKVVLEAKRRRVVW